MVTFGKNSLLFLSEKEAHDISTSQHSFSQHHSNYHHEKHNVICKFPLGTTVLAPFAGVSENMVVVAGVTLFSDANVAGVVVAVARIIFTVVGGVGGVAVAVTSFVAVGVVVLDCVAAAAAAAALVVLLAVVVGFDAKDVVAVLLVLVFAAVVFVLMERLQKLFPALILFSFAMLRFHNIFGTHLIL